MHSKNNYKGYKIIQSKNICQYQKQVGTYMLAWLNSIQYIGYKLILISKIKP